MSSMGLASDLCLGRPSDHHPDLLSGHGLQQQLALVNSAHNNTEAGANNNPSLIQLETYVRALEHERQKIDAFHRELPICMKLLEEAIEASRMKLATKTVQDDYSTATVPNTAAQQVPSRAIYRHSQMNNTTAACTTTSAAAAAESGISNSSLSFSAWPGPAAASNWAPDIQKAQYETCTAQYITQLQQELSKPAQLINSSPDLINWTNHQVHRVSPRRCSDQQMVPDTMVMETCNNYINSNNGDQQRSMLMDQLMTATHLGTISAAQHQQLAAAGHHHQQQQQQQQHHQPPRKARRCWSPELHQRFLHALHQLGGPHLATPKQIREVMNVEGLTNDEVKSHLQKYRLHTRRPVPQPSDQPAQQPHHLVLFGGIWMPSTAAVDQATSPAAAAAQLAAAAGIHVDPLRSFCHPSTPNARSAADQSSFMHTRTPINLRGHGESSLHGELDCPAGMESASEEDVARSDQSTSLNQHDDDADTQIHLVSNPTRGLF